MPHFRPIPREKWVKFLKNEGLECIRTTASHELWDRPGKRLDRPVVFRRKDRDIPPLHLGTCLKTLGISKQEFLAKIADI